MDPYCFVRWCARCLAAPPAGELHHQTMALKPTPARWMVDCSIHKQEGWLLLLDLKTERRGGSRMPEGRGKRVFPLVPPTNWYETAADCYPPTNTGRPIYERFDLERSQRLHIFSCYKETDARKNAAMPSAVTARSPLSCVNHHNSAIHWRHLA